MSEHLSGPITTAVYGKNKKGAPRKGGKSSAPRYRFFTIENLLPNDSLAALAALKDSLK